MMNNLQMLIDEIKAEREKASNASDFYNIEGNRWVSIVYEECANAFYRIEQKAELLLLNEPEAITETALCANTMLGDSAASLESSTIEEAAAVSSETRGVRQNEQTKEVCDNKVEKSKDDDFSYGGIFISM